MSDIHETRVLFGYEGEILHVDHDGATASWLPDSRDFWLKLLQFSSELKLLGVAHTHPWRGIALPSMTDLKTAMRVDQYLGQPLVWLVVTESDRHAMRRPLPQDGRVLPLSSHEAAIRRVTRRLQDLIRHQMTGHEVDPVASLMES